MKGIVTSVTTNGSNPYISYMYGGSSTARSYAEALNKCREKAYGSIPSPYDIKNIA